MERILDIVSMKAEQKVKTLLNSQDIKIPNLRYYSYNAISEIRAALNYDRIRFTDFPEELYNTAADMVAGTFILDYSESLPGQDGSGAITSIHEGDVSVNFDVSSSSHKILINRAQELSKVPKEIISRFRIIRW